MPYKKLVYANQIETFFTFFQFSELFQKLLNTNPFLKKETVQRIAFRQDVPLKSSLFRPFSAQHRTNSCSDVGDADHAGDLVLAILVD